jgi:hypothetical protein
MLINFTRNKRVLRMATFALVAFSLFQLPVDVQSSGESNETIVTGETALLGLARGESLRFSAFNPSKTESGRRNGPISMQLKLYDAQGNVIAESAEVEIPPGEFRFVDFNHDDLPGAAEPGAARNQIRTQALWGLRTSGRILITASLEIVDNSTGKTTVAHTIGLRHEHVRPE